MNYNKHQNHNSKLSLASRQAAVFGISLFVILLTVVLVFVFTRNDNPKSDAIHSDSVTTYDVNPITTSPSEITSKITEAAETEKESKPVTNVVDTLGGDTTEDSTTKSVSETSSWTPVITAPDELAEQYPGIVLTETTDAGDDYIKQIIFLGDSTTYGLKYYKALEAEQVWTPSSGTLTLDKQSFAKILYPNDGTEILIKEAAAKSKPKYMVITLGVNGISYLDEETFKKEYTNLIQDILAASPDTIVMIQSIFPVARSYQYQKSINNEKINQANIWLVEMADSLGLKYLNTASVLMDDEGYLPEDYQNGDGLHLNEVSAALVVQYIRTHAYVK